MSTLDLKRSFKEIEIKDGAGEPMVKIPAMCFGGIGVHAPVFGYHGHQPDWTYVPQYTLTHIPTGLALGYTPFELEKVLQAAEYLAVRFRITPEDDRDPRKLISFKREVFQLRAHGLLFFHPLSKEQVTLINSFRQQDKEGNPIPQFAPHEEKPDQRLF